MLKFILLLLVLLLAVPIGFLLAKATREELKQGRKAFRAIRIASLLVILIILLVPLQTDNKLFLIMNMLFIFILTLISLKKSYLKIKK